MNIVKLAAAGAGAYLLWQWWSKQQQQQPSSVGEGYELAPQPAAQPTVIQAGQQPAPPRVVSIDSRTTAPAIAAGPAAPPAPTADMVIEAATDPVYGATLGDRVLLTADQWNFYNAQGTGVQTTVDLFPPDDRGQVMTAGEYWGRRAAAGLAGFALRGATRWLQ